MSDYVSTQEAFRRLAGMDLPDWPVLLSAITERSLRSGENLFHAGEALPSVLVVNQGILTMTYETRDGDSWVKGFAEAGMCFASLTALEPGGVTSYAARAEVDSHVSQIKYSVLTQLADRHPAWQRALSQAYRFYGRRKEQREMDLLTLTPTERYLRFMTEHPNLAAVIRQREIASYVRITPVALSRIKSRLKAT